ncbi:EAL domain-containing protein [Halomonas sp. Y3]|uniref:EAL domain-containing protein n=1 Tax=Halomonas sp. Y3 TaxID=2956797 RepID=UPI0020A01866|nr:EAL domain-containing protein [Halomonas sp. Y3]
MPQTTSPETEPLRVSAIMQTGLLTCMPETPVVEAAARMTERRFSAILVLEGQCAVGIWTERDSLRLALEHPEEIELPIHRVMTPVPLQVAEDCPVAEVSDAFKAHGIRHAVIVDGEGKVRGIVSQTDLALKQGIEPYLRLREVRRVMRSPVEILDGQRTLQEIAGHMLEQRLDAVIVDCGQGELGILTERDVLRYVARHRRDLPVCELASRPLRSLPVEARLIDARHQFIDQRLRHLAVVDAAGEVVGLLGFRDILDGVEGDYAVRLREVLQERDHALERSRLTLQLAERVIDASLQSIMITDARGRIDFINPAFTHLTGYTLDEVSGRTPALLSSGRHDAAFYAEMWHTLQERGSWRGEIWNRRKSGQLYLELLTITAIYDEHGQATHYAALFSDITHIRENEEKVRRLAYYDPLTQLPNRRLLEDRLSLAIRHSHRQRKRLAVVFVDLDHFKQINDSMGHAAGDALLVEVAKRMQDALREDDTLARLGGDEFIVLLPELGEIEAARQVAERLIDSISTSFRVGEHDFRIGCSLGISLYPDDADSVELLIQYADAAMYRAKQEGRNTYRFFHRQQLQWCEPAQLTLESALRDTADSGEGLAVHYQPLINRDSGELEGAEALLRWHHPVLGDISPGQFIPVAERSGLMIVLGDWVMEQAARQLAAWRDEGRQAIRVAINLSGRQFWDRALIDKVRDCHRRYALMPGQLGFEITESVLLDQQQPAAAIIQALRDMGCRVALDDFGTGYSSLGYLHELPVSTIKIDQRFIQGLGNRRSNAIVAAVTGLARELDMRVVAEGVETDQQLQALARYPIDLVQGFLFDTPLLADAFAERWLT